MTSFFLFGLLATYFAGRASSSSCDLPTLSLPLGPCNISLSSQDAVYSYGLLLTVDGTRLCSTPSTFATTPLFDHEDVCSPENMAGSSHKQCKSRRGNLLPASIATESTDSLKGLNVNLETFKIPIDKAAKPTIELQPGRSVQVSSVLITRWENHTNSHFPLNDQSTILSQGKDSGVIGARSFAIDVGSQMSLSGRRGRLTLGGWHPEMVKGPFIEYDMKNYTQFRNDRLCPLQVGIETLEITVGDEVVKVISRDMGAVACIEPYDRHFRLIEAQLANLKGVISRKHKLDEASDAPGIPYGRYDQLLDLEPGLVYRNNISSNNIISRMQITLKKGLQVTLNSEDIVQSLRGLDQDGVPTVNQSMTEVGIYREPGLGDASILGRAFLAKVYMFVDYEKSVFRLGLLDEEALLQAPISSGSCGNSSLSAEAKGLVSIGVIVFVFMVLIGLLALFLWRKLRKSEARLRDSEAQLSEQKTLLGGQRDNLEKVKRDVMELQERPVVQSRPPRGDSPGPPGGSETD